MQSGNSPARHSIQQPQQPQMQTLPRQIVEGRGNQRSPAAPAQRSPAAPAQRSPAASAPLQQNTGLPVNFSPVCHQKSSTLIHIQAFLDFLKSYFRNFYFRDFRFTSIYAVFAFICVPTLTAKN